jgi:hypothetical protein
MDSAFGSLRRHARDRNERLVDLCASITSGDTDLGSIQVDFFTMTRARRLELRDRALARWAETSAATVSQRERAILSVSRSVELRVELEHARALRVTDAMGRAIDRHFRQRSRIEPTEKVLPRILVREGSEPMRSFVIDTLRGDLRFEVGSRSTEADTLAMGMVEQPDLVILGLDQGSSDRGVDTQGVGGDAFRTHLRRYCPDSRILVVIGESEGDRGGCDSAGVGTNGYDGIVTYGDAPALVELAAKLCGLRAGQRA